MLQLINIITNKVNLILAPVIGEVAVPEGGEISEGGQPSGDTGDGDMDFTFNYKVILISVGMVFFVFVAVVSLVYFLKHKKPKIVKSNNKSSKKSLK